MFVTPRSRPNLCVETQSRATFQSEELDIWMFLPLLALHGRCFEMDAVNLEGSVEQGRDGGYVRPFESTVFL